MTREEKIRIMPTVALRGLVVFPDMFIHFDVGREKSINAINAAMADDRMIYLVNPKAPCFIKDAAGKYIYLILPVNFTTVS